jgi:hypothetical protein
VKRRKQPGEQSDAEGKPFYWRRFFSSLLVH